MKKKRLVCILMTFSLSVAVSLMPTLVGADQQGVTEDTIVVGSYQSLSGPAAITSLVGKGADAYFKSINDKNGIHGRKVKFIMEDDQAQVARVVATVKKFVERDRVFALVAGLNPGGTIATMKYLTKKKVPHVSVVASSTLALPPKKYLFVVRPVSYVEGRIMAKYAIENLQAKRIGVFYEDSNFGTDALKGIIAELEKRGMKPVAKVSYSQEDTEYSTQALLLKRAKPDLVFLLSLFRFTARFLQETEKIGFKPTWFALSVNNTPVTIKLSGKAADGLLASASLPSVASKIPAVVEYRKWFSKFYPKENVYNSLPLVGWSAAQVFSEAAKRAGRNLTTDGFIRAMESFDNWRGGIAHRLTFSTGRRDGQRAMRICQVKGGRFVQIHDFIEFKFQDK